MLFNMNFSEGKTAHPTRRNPTNLITSQVRSEKKMKKKNEKEEEKNFLT